MYIGSGQENVDGSNAAQHFGLVVVVMSQGTNATRTVHTNKAVLPLLPPGIYTAWLKKRGIRRVTRRDIEVQVRQPTRIDLILEVGSTAGSLEVGAQAVQLITENPTVGTVIENRRIVDLPFNGRKFLQLIASRPNVTTGFASLGAVSRRLCSVKGKENTI